MNLHALWNTLLYGETQDRKDYKNTYPRKGGLEYLARERLGELDSAELQLLRAMIYRAAKDRDTEFLDDAEELCESLGLNHKHFMKAINRIWDEEDKCLI